MYAVHVRNVYEREGKQSEVSNSIKPFAQDLRKIGLNILIQKITKQIY